MCYTSTTLNASLYLSAQCTAAQQPSKIQIYCVGFAVPLRSPILMPCICNGAWPDGIVLRSRKGGSKRHESDAGNEEIFPKTSLSNSTMSPAETISLFVASAAINCHGKSNGSLPSKCFWMNKKSDALMPFA